LLPVGFVIPDRQPGKRPAFQREAPTDSFPHSRHTTIPCLRCHLPTGDRGRLTFEPPRGCQNCHHQDAGPADCSRCHMPDALASPITVQVGITVPGQATRTRSVAFPHGKHLRLGCARCHIDSPSLEPADSVLTCHACHGDHHEPARSCATCHKTEAITAAHEPPGFRHMGCDACHTRSRVAMLVPSRSFCLVCHDQAQDHHAPKPCTNCHFLWSPEELRHQLTQTGTP